MKNKGFTLIELLAVIVILAIIALIATPVVLNIIKDSKNSTVERSAELYLDQLKNEIAKYNMTHPSSNFNPSECIVQSDDSLICDGVPLNIEITGDKPEAGSKITLSNGSITGLEDFKIGSKNLTYENGKIKEEDGTASKLICEAVGVATTGNVPTGNFNYGDEYTCQVGDNYTNTFFVLENNTDTVSLIMKENFVDSYVPQTLFWCTDGEYTVRTCKSLTATGSNALTGKDYLGHIKEVFNKNEIEVSFPSADQIALASGYTFTTADEHDTWYLPIWLYDYLDGTTHPISGIKRYWTTTSFSNMWCDTVYAITSKGILGNGVCYSNETTDSGVRPVITISKSMIE